MTEQYGVGAYFDPAPFQSVDAVFHPVEISVGQQQALPFAFPDPLAWRAGTDIAIAGHGNDVDAECMGDQVHVIVAIAQMDDGIARERHFTDMKKKGNIAMGIGNDQDFHGRSVANQSFS